MHDEVLQIFKKWYFTKFPSHWLEFWVHARMPLGCKMFFRLFRPFNAAVNVWRDPPGHRSTANDKTYERRFFGARRDVRKNFPRNARRTRFFRRWKNVELRVEHFHKTNNDLMHSTRIRRILSRRTESEMRVEWLMKLCEGETYGSQR